MSTRLRFAYRMRIYCLGDWPFDRWLAASAFLAAGGVLAAWWIAGRPLPLTWHWLAFLALLLAGSAVIWLSVWAARRGYVVFRPQDDECNSSPPIKLTPTDKIPLRATGRFGVEGKTHVWADLQAYWRTFATREHAVLTFTHASRWLLLAQIPEAAVGMWYIFFKPQAIEAITPGLLTFGKATRPALRVIYRGEPPPHRRRAPQEIHETVYLAFDAEAERDRVWGDLMAD